MISQRLALGFEYEVRYPEDRNAKHSPGTSPLWNVLKSLKRLRVGQFGLGFLLVVV